MIKVWTKPFNSISDTIEQLNSDNIMGDEDQGTESISCYRKLAVHPKNSTIEYYVKCFPIYI
jgi:hypothetical protein